MTPPPSPYAQAMLDYWRGNESAAYIIRRDDGFSDRVSSGDAFCTPRLFNALEQLAVDRCHGNILDVGAGAGRHSLALQERGGAVTALEVVPELAGIMAERGVSEVLTGSVFALTNRKFDTFLMLMNGFGLVGTLAGAHTFLEHARSLLSSHGQILCDSFDVRKTANPVHLAYHESNRRAGRPAGQMRFAIEYGGHLGEPFDWLHIDFDCMRDLAQAHGFTAEMLVSEASGHYLARLTNGHP